MATSLKFLSPTYVDRIIKRKYAFSYKRVFNEKEIETDTLGWQNSNNDIQLKICVAKEYPLSTILKQIETINY